MEAIIYAIYLYIFSPFFNTPIVPVHQKEKKKRKEIRRVIIYALYIRGLVRPMDRRTEMKIMKRTFPG